MKQVAERLDISYGYVCELLKSGRLTATKVKGRNYISIHSVEFYERTLTHKNDSRGKSWSELNQGDKRGIVQTLLLAGIITAQDVADMERQRLLKAVKMAQASPEDVRTPE